MDGKALLYQIRMLLEEDSDSSFMDDFLSYQFVNEAASEFVLRTKCLKAEQEITIVADTAAYALDADFLGLYLQNKDKKYVVKYYDGTNYSFITWKPYEEIVLANQTDSVSIPSWFSIIDNSTLGSTITGTVTSAGDETGGESTLTDSGGGLSAAAAGDSVHNTTDASMGVVTSVTGDTAVNVALFGGTDNEWDTSDAYVIQPQGRYQLVLAPPPSTAGHTVTVYHLERPAPVYSDYGTFRFSSHYIPAVVKYAAWLYKYRDSEPNYGDKWYQYFDMQVRKFGDQVNSIQRRRRFTVNRKAR